MDFWFYVGAIIGFVSLFIWNYYFVPLERQNFLGQVWLVIGALILSFTALVSALY